MTSTIAKPQIEIDQAIRELLQQQFERCTIVHCRIFTDEPTGVRIWPQTYLIEQDGQRKKLIKAFNISLMPEWTIHEIYSGYIHFTLVFEGLGKDCSSFELLEDIAELNGFYSNTILRNNSDVYSAELFT